jgi:hypothetical protein
VRGVDATKIGDPPGSSDRIAHQFICKSTKLCIVAAEVAELSVRGRTLLSGSSERQASRTASEICSSNHTVHFTRVYIHLKKVEIGTERRQ